MRRRPDRIVALAVVLAFLCAGCAPHPGGYAGPTGSASASPTPTSSAPAAPATLVQRWLKHVPVYIAHRGGDGDWTEGTTHAYAEAAAWNPGLALEVPVRMTSDGVWVVSEDPTTGRVFGTDYRIRTTPWAKLARLRTRLGHFPMTRLDNDVLRVYGDQRILFVDDKADANIESLLTLLDAHGGRNRCVIKSYWASTDVSTLAHAAGYLVWGYYYAKDMPQFPDTQSRFDLLGLDFTAPAADFAQMRATGKPVIAHIIETRSEAAIARSKGAQGFMVSGVEQVVPR